MAMPERGARLEGSGNATVTKPTLRDVEAAARVMVLQTQVFEASISREIDSAFSNALREYHGNTARALSGVGINHAVDARIASRAATKANPASLL
jgi:hypothetical protein